ncbi:hypothetical protein CEXT_744301 [Caerostris extrusa]|uniref:Uncharacterized protein n=1 Tax=Caerostris extrusa TaxID=172846 RepID=A0AAV4Y949_CAEEX|nr:hypothetical protein CEXT_744301 [Caerostris extrusa]
MSVRNICKACTGSKQRRIMIKYEIECINVFDSLNDGGHDDDDVHDDDRGAHGDHGDGRDAHGDDGHDDDHGGDHDVRDDRDDGHDDHGDHDDRDDDALPLLPLQRVFLIHSAEQQPKKQRIKQQ